MPFGWSTGALAKGDVAAALQMLDERPDLKAVELSALRMNELDGLAAFTKCTDLGRFDYVSIHAPTDFDGDTELDLITKLRTLADRGWPVVVHPDTMHKIEAWRSLGDHLVLENMDRRKPVGRTADELQPFFDQLPEARLCLDLGHARQFDPTMSQAARIISSFKERLAQLHISEVYTSGRHGPLTLHSVASFRRVARMLPDDVPVIIESVVDESRIAEQTQLAREAVSPSEEPVYV